MERSAPASTSKTYVTWEEIFVTSGKGRREVRYYLKRPDGTSDLAVIGKEASLRHMSYRYTLRDKSLLSVLSSSSMPKLRSRREVIDWLNSIVTDSPLDQSQQVGGSLGSKKVCEMEFGKAKDVQLSKLGQYNTNFSWLGSPWTCRKRRRHYPSFDRNGVKISVHEFVYVLAEENKRLVAYLDDMYEDSRGNKMVVVRWFHRIDEVGIILPQNYNDREIFFSLCLQDLSIECVDGLATVLCPQHYDKFLNEAAPNSQLEPYICHRQFDNDDIESFDVTQMKGYWKQELVRYIFNTSPSRTLARSQLPGHHSDAFNTRPRKRLCRLKDKQETEDRCLDTKSLDENSSVLKKETEMGNAKDVVSASPASGKEGVIPQKPIEHLSLGSQVEVLSQDSGIRGCWFRALIIKKHKDKVKVQYRDLKDAADEAKKLEEWVLASRVAIDDELGVRIHGRPTIRPALQSNKGKVSWVVNVGTIVDVWWHDGWWEGIVVQKETGDKFHVYFPGEKRESVFTLSELRHSQEWLRNGWKNIKERPDVVASISRNLKTKTTTVNLRNDSNNNEIQMATTRDKKPDCIVQKDEVRSSNSKADLVVDEVKKDAMVVVRDLSKDELLSQLKWKSSRKRRRHANYVKKLHYGNKENIGRKEKEASRMQQFLFSTTTATTLKVDSDNCKYIRESSLFNSSVVPTLTNLVMSR